MTILQRVSGTRNIAPASGYTSTATTITAQNGYVIVQYGDFTVADNTGTNQTIIQNNANNVGNIINNPNGGDPSSIDQTLYSTTAERELASAYFAGGVGIEKDLAVGGFIYGRISQANTATTTTNIVINTTNADQIYYPVFTDQNGLAATNGALYGDNVGFAGGLTYDAFTGKLISDQMFVASDANSSSTVTGAFTVTGGVGIGQDIYVGGNVYPGSSATNSTNSIGGPNDAWARGYLNSIYTNFVGNTFGNINISPNNGVNLPTGTNGDNVIGGGTVDIFGEIRVRGNNPVGTAPVVTNVLYVTMDGDDTNDGRAMDPSRACRTISGAVNSPYYQSGTQIRVSPGHYLENNPIQLKRYTSIMGSDLRTTGIEPINKTQDLFHMNSGCYLAFMQFLNGRSGLLPGNNYINGTNRGAYCTAFPPLLGNDRIDLFHSPYIQNCTNLSGPWINDGSMFVPDETIQIPIAVGTGTWAANTTSIVVNFQGLPINGFINAGTTGSNATQYSNTASLQNSVVIKGTLATSNSLSSITSPILNDGYIMADTGNLWVYTGASTIGLGLSVSSGQQNPGFFNARTLILANKPFLQTQIVSYIDQVFNSGSTFSYNTTTCARDVGLIIDVIGQDLLYNSTSDSTFTGLQYWSQDLGFTGSIPSEITATKAAILHLQSLAVALVSPASQSTVNILFGNISNILNNGPTGITNNIIVGTLPTTSTSILSDVAILQSNLTSLQSSIVTWVNTNYNSLSYNTSTCYRDVGYIINSVCFDMLNGGNLQTIKSGIYYYAYDSTSTQIPSEIPQTIAAYSFIQSIIPQIVSGTKIVNPYQTAVTQVIGGTPASASEINILQSNIGVITGIIVGGPGIAGPKTPQNLSTTPDPNAVNAWTLLHANKAFIQAEVIAFVAKVFTGKFIYNKQLSYRDTGILVENIAYDVAFGGNQKSVESGLAYWNGPISYIATSIPQCTAAINYLNDLIQIIITNTPCPVLPSVAGIPQSTQVINTVMTGGQIAAPSITSAFSTIIDIINNGPSAAPALYTSTGPDAAYASAEILLQANRTFIQEQTINYINWNLVQPKSATYLPYNKVKCERDTYIIVDSIASDLLYPTAQYSQTTFAGLQYYNQSGYIGNITKEITTTTSAMAYLQQIAVKVIQNITPTQDLLFGVTRYSTATQVTTIQPATASEVAIINNEFGIILSILNGQTIGWTDQIIPNGAPSQLLNVQDAYNNLLANLSYMQNEVYAYVTSPTGLNYSPTYFNTTTCIRDVGYIINSVAFDLLHGGNRQAIQSGLSYYQQNPNGSVIPQETSATVAAFNYLGSIISTIATSTNYIPLQSKVSFVATTTLATSVPTQISQAVSSLTNILSKGPTGYEFTPISLTATTSSNAIAAYNIIETNRPFLVAETLAWIDQTYNAGSFAYNQDVCYRDVGLMVDAVSQDILLGGNQRSIEAGLSYWNEGYNYVYNEISTITQAISYISAISKQIIANTTVTSITGTIATQVINPYFQYGNNYMPQQSVTRNFGIISNIIANGVQAAPPVYAGSGLFALTGLNGADVKNSPTVTYVSQLSTGTYLIGLSTATVGFGQNATLYFGNTYVWPLQNLQVEALSLQQTGSTSTWNQRKIDPIGGMGGSLVDGAVISDKSPIQSFVYDAFTQLTQGGRGVHITNNGYAQLVSVFTIFGSVGVQVDNGGIASIVNSNANFGDICLLAKGYGKRAFSGTLYNPANRAYPFSPGSDGLDQYYPNGFWPNGGNIEVFVPDLANRPHISLVMEVVPPTNYTSSINSTQLAQNGVVLEGFLNAQPSTGTLIAGSIELTNIDTTNVYIGNTVYIVDQFGYPYDHFPYIHDEFGNYLTSTGTIATTTTQYVTNTNYMVWYCVTGTYVTDVNYNSISLSSALTAGANYQFDTNYFTLYFCGNAYYSVMTSNPANSPYAPNTNILSANSNTNYQGPAVNQIPAHAAAMHYLNSITNKVISNIPVTKSVGNYSTQYINGSLTNGSGSIPFVNLEFRYLTNILTATNINSALSVIPSASIVQSGTIPSGAGSAITLIQDNIDFLTQEVVAYVNNNFANVYQSNNYCYRDTGLIVDAIGMDLLYGSSSDSTFSGLQYWSQDTGFTGSIPNESTATIAAIGYLGTLVQGYVSSINKTTVSNLFNEINTILVNGPQNITNSVIYGGLPTTDTNTLNDVSTLQGNVSTIQTLVINWITTNYPSLVYNQTTCRRDVGYIINAICFDLTNGGNVQSIKSGVYYYGYDSGSSVIPNESTATIAAYNYMKSIIPSIVEGIALTGTYQTSVTQIISGYTPATYAEATTLQNNINVITGIISGGPSSAGAKTPQSSVESTNTNVVNAWGLLHANRGFIQAEIIAYIAANYSNVYNPYAMTDSQAQKCVRDVGLILQQLIYDLETGGNYNMVYSGLSYWSRPGTYHVVELGEAVTDPSLFPDGAIVNFYQRSYISASGYVFEYVGAGTNYGALPQVGQADPIQGRETVQLNSGKVFFTSTDQNGDFRIGPGLVISQATGVISGRTFTESLFANMTPFILAIEGI